MQMRDGVYRIMRIAVVAGLAWGGFVWLSPMGYGWVVWVLLGAFFAVWAYKIFRARRRHAAEEAEASRFAEALMDGSKRPAVIAELRAELEAMDRDKESAQHASRSLLLAEFLEAAGAPEDARAALDAVDDAKLSEVMGAVLRHARAVSSLSAGDPVAARAALDELPGPSGDRLVDQRIALARGMIAVEEGTLDEAMRIADRMRDEAADPDIRVEARLLKAVAQDAAGKRDAALRAIATLNEELLTVLAVLGLPRVKRLVAAMLEQPAAGPAAEADRAVD